MNVPIDNQLAQLITKCVEQMVEEKTQELKDKLDQALRTIDTLTSELKIVKEGKQI